MLEINTNNYIETWHNTLKSSYLGRFRKQRTDILIHLVLREVLPDFRIKVAIGLERRRLSDAEKAQGRKFNELSTETATSLVRLSVVEVGEADYFEVIMVKSFTIDGQEYLVSMDQASTIHCCSCSYTTYSKTVCKHMFLSQLVLGYSISYDTRLNKTADLSRTSRTELTAKPSTENDARQESDNRAKALILEQARFINSYANDSSCLNDEEREIFDIITTQISRLKRCRDPNDKLWSKRQRR